MTSSKSKCTRDGLAFGCDSRRAINKNVACFVGMPDDVPHWDN